MIIRTLQVENFRNLARVEIEAHPGLNVFHGANGAGKTSVLESLVVLSRGRSFRTTQASELIGRAGRIFRVFAVTEGPGEVSHRLGLERSGSRWRGRKDGADLSQLSQLTRSLPLVLMEPDSHLLVSGTPEVRRRYIDWGMFHVEQRFLDTWRRYSKALKQRNAALRESRRAVLDSLDVVLCEHAERLTAFRRRHCEAVSASIQLLLDALGSTLPEIRLEYQQGWSGERYATALDAGRQRDVERGITITGPHRADLVFTCGGASARAILSRGEQKVLAAALLLTQAELLAAAGQHPVLLLDDLASEFDRDHFDRVLRQALATQRQVWLTGTRNDAGELAGAVFHVEQGVVRKVL